MLEVREKFEFQIMGGSERRQKYADQRYHMRPLHSGLSQVRKKCFF